MTVVNDNHVATEFRMATPLSTSLTAGPLWFFVATSLLLQMRKSRSPVPTGLLMLFAITLSLSVFLEPLLVPLLSAAGAWHGCVSCRYSSMLAAEMPFVHRQVPSVPGISPAAAPLPDSTPGATPPAPIPSTLPPAPVASPGGTVAPTTTVTSVNQSTGLSPSRDECAAGLRRIQAVLLLELLIEIIFLFIRCCADHQFDDPPGSEMSPRVDVTFRGYVFLRTIYAIPVVILNCAIYWIGGGPTGTCEFSFVNLTVNLCYHLY